MADNLDSTIKSLDDLGRKSVSVSKLLEGSLANRLLDIANISEKTGRRWTIMSRLLSGSPLWKIQNKVRAVVDSLGMVREGVNKVAKEMSEADGSFIRYAKGYQAMEQQMMDASEAFNNTIYHGKIGWSKLNDDVQKAIKGTESYNKTLLATGSARKAQVASMTTLREKYKEAAKEHEKVKASVKEEYAFDKRRIEQAKKAAEYRAEVLKGGKRTIRKAGKKAAKQEKWQMKQDQKAVTKGAKKDSAKNTMKGLLNTSAFKPLLMPLKAFALPLVGMFKIAKNRKKYQMGINRMKDKMIPVVNMAFKFFIFAIVGIISFFLFIKFFMKAFDKLKELGIIDDIKEYVGELIVFGKMIFDTIKTFMDGGFEEGMKKLGPLLDKGISLILEGAMIIAKLAYAFIITGIDMIVDFFTLLWTDKAFRDSVINIGIKVGKMILFAWMVKTLVIAALHLVATLALPFIFFGLGLILLVVAAKIIYNIAKRYGSEVATTLTWWAQKYLNFIIAIRDFLTGGKVVDTIVSKGAKLATWLGTTFTNIIADALSMDIAGNYDKANTAINESGFGKWLAGIGLHKGGMTHGNMNLVGETGPEFVKLPAGSRVYSHSQSRGMGGSSAPNNFHITINARDTSDVELRRIADKIGQMVNSKINRRTSSGTLG